MLVQRAPHGDKLTHVIPRDLCDNELWVFKQVIMRNNTPYKTGTIAN